MNRPFLQRDPAGSTHARIQPRWPTLLLVLLVSCAQMPMPEAGRPDGAHFSASDTTSLGRLAAPPATVEAGQSGLLVLDTGREAFRQRATLIDAAERAIDAQYYIWNSDRTGRALALRLLAAADRGVKVRVLLDDINVGNRDSVLAALDAHENIDIRIYNPFAQRSGLGRMFDFLGEFTRLNRRMHNKSFTVDGAVTILGGRNIGDEYFDAGKDLNFRDRDVLVTGPVVADVGTMFDTFWNAPISISISELAAKSEPPEQREVGAQAETSDTELTATFGALPTGSDDPLEALAATLQQLQWASARLVHDLPPASEEFGETDEPQPSARALAELAARAQNDILIESAYLVLDDTGLETMRSMHRDGVRVRALTNSLSSNDVTANHAAYAGRRRQILESGIELYELRPDAESCPQMIGQADACSETAVFGLHAKTFVVDRRWVYIGSLNLNLRSRYLNAESGLIIDSPQLARSICSAIEQNMDPGNSWRLSLDEDGRLEWRSRDRDGTWRDARRDPDTSWWRRTTSGFISLLPLEKYL